MKIGLGQFGTRSGSHCGHVAGGIWGQRARRSKQFDELAKPGNHLGQTWLSKDLLWLQLHENIHLTNLDPLDLSAAIAQARDRNYTLAQIAKEMGKSEAWVQKSLTIATRLDEEAKFILQSAEQRPARDTVYAIAQAPVESQSELARRVANECLTRRETQALAEAARLSNPAAETPLRMGRPRSFRSFETTLRAANGGSVTVKFRKADVTHEEIVAAMEDVLKTLRLQVAVA